MIAGILPVVILLAVAFWGVYESGRKFRREFAKRGRSWAEVVAAMHRGEGTLIIDHLWGPQRGLGRPVIWWTSHLLSEADEQEIAEHANLTRCPRELRNKDALRRQFPSGRIIEHAWGFDPELLERKPAEETTKVG